MLKEEEVELRARSEADVAVLHAELYDDVATRVRSDPAVVSDSGRLADIAVSGR